MLARHLKRVGDKIRCRREFVANIIPVLLRYKLKKRQIRMLRRFAQMMRWPNLADTLDNMKQKDSELALDEVSSDAFAFFSGLVLPGVSLPAY